jgi:hypothetical protein
MGHSDSHSGEAGGEEALRALPPRDGLPLLRRKTPGHSERIGGLVTRIPPKESRGAPVPLPPSGAQRFPAGDAVAAELIAGLAPTWGGTVPELEAAVAALLR